MALLLQSISSFGNINLLHSDKLEMDCMEVFDRFAGLTRREGRNRRIRKERSTGKQSLLCNSIVEFWTRFHKHVSYVSEC
jgi:hypothetical protein